MSKLLPQRSTRALLGALTLSALTLGAFAQDAPAQDAPAQDAASASQEAKPLDVKPLDAKALDALLKRLDERQRTMSDYKALVYIEQRQKDRAEQVYEAAIYRRDQQQQMVIMFVKPTAEAGKGYLRLDKNLFFYDPNVGKWERRTERESIGGTDSRRRDFDATSFAQDYTPSYVAQEKLGKFDVHHIQLKVKAGRDVAYPVMHIWVDTREENLLKVQELALSGKLLRSAYYPKWAKLESPDKGSPVYYPREIRIFDEVEKDNRTTIVMRKVDLQKLPDTIFTKAWMESKSR